MAELSNAYVCMAFGFGELGLELIQPHMTQKPVLRGKVGARAWRVCGQTREEIWAGACGARRMGESACVVKPIKAWLRLWG